MLEGPKSAKDLSVVIDFLNKNLRPGHTWSISEEYPTVFTPQNLRNLQIIESSQSAEETKVLSHAAVHPSVVRTPYAIFKLAAIGSVVTDPSYRKQGLSHKIIRKCIDQARSENCDFAILWTDLFEFYRKMGFELVGTECSVVWDKSIVQEPTPHYRFSNQNNISAATLLQVYNKHTVGSVRTLAQTQKYLAIPNTELFTCWSADHRLLAYAVIGKGADLANYVHEWGGGTQELIELFDYAFKTKGTTLTVICPKHSGNLLDRCKQAQLTINYGHLGMIKILDQDSFFRKITRRARTLGASDFLLEVKKDKIVLTTDGHQLEFQNERDLSRLIFGPDKCSRLLPNHPVAQRLDKIFPIEMWVWGWDSI